MKRIQAQRKFAQGAPIPSNNFSNSERRVDVTPVKEETRNIVHNNTPAKTFLDFISFNQIHEHRVPVVLLERLKTNPTNPFIINQKIEELAGTVEPKITTNLRSHTSIENKSEGYHMEIDDPVVIEKITNVLIQTPNLENGTDIEGEEPINSNRLSGLKMAQKNSLYSAMKSSGCNISDASVDEDMMPLASYAVKKKRLILNKTKRLTIDEKRKNKILKKSQLPNRFLVKKPPCRGRKRVNLGVTEVLDESNTVSKKNTTANKKDNLRSSRNCVVKKVLVEPSTRRLRNQNGSLVNSEHQARDIKHSSNKNAEPTKKSTRIESKNKKCKGVNQKRKYLYEMCSNKNKKTKHVPKIDDVVFKDSPSADSSPDTSTPAHSSSQIINSTSPGLTQNCMSLNEIFEASEADDSLESCHQILVSKIRDVVSQDTPSADSSPNTSTSTPAPSQIIHSTSPGPSQNCTTLSEIFEASEAEDSIESCDHKLVSKIQTIVFKDTPSADSSPNTSTPVNISNKRNHTSSGRSPNRTTLSEIFEASEADDSSESCHHRLVSKIEDVVSQDSPGADSSPNTSTPAPCSSQRIHTSPGPSQNCTTLSEIFEATKSEDSLESWNHRFVSQIEDVVCQDTPSADRSSNTSTPVSGFNERNHMTSPGPSQNCTTLSEIFEATKSEDSLESWNHGFVSQIEDVVCQDTPSADRSSNTSTPVPGFNKRNHMTSPGPSENCTTLSETFEASEADDSSESCVQCRDMENIMKLQELTDQTCKNLINSSNASHRDNDSLNHGESSNLWKEQHTLDLNLSRKNMLRMKFCTHTKSKKTKPVVACSLVSNQNDNGNDSETRFPKDVKTENGMSNNNNNNNNNIIIIDLTESESVPISETSRSETVCSNTENNCRTRSKTNPSLTNTRCVPLLAPVFTPTAAEFSDPVAYLDSIMPKAKEFGICKVVPPANFVPTCNVNDKMVFNATNQYIARLFSRWGPGSKEMSTIKAYLASQSVVFKRAPLYEGMEVNLPKLYQLVQRHGGLKEVIERKRWSRVAEEMHFTKRPNPEKKLDQLYVKYLLPYDTLSSSERSQIMSKVERGWSKKYRKMIQRAFNPLHRQNRLLNGCESSEEDDEDSDDDEYITGALAEAEECVVPGRKMNLATFKKVATTAIDTFFSSTSYPTPAEVEQEYWRLVLHGTDHVCVNSASIDTGSAGYGFTNKKSDEYGDHPWNLKMLANNNSNILRFLGQVLGVTVPTLHLGMVFSTSCWHRDPHSLPWMEFMHSGPPKIWYGIPDGQSKQFRKAVESLCPTSCLNKSMWLPSDITMIPPELLLEHNVSLSRVEQNPGEYIFVFPKAYSSSISTGFTISESVYFASISWLQKGLKCFSEAQISCEPTMISVESLLIAVVTSPQQSLEALLPALSMLSCLLLSELQNRKTIVEELAAYPRSTRFLEQRRGPWNVRDQDECEVCRKTLFMSRIRGLTKNNTSLCLEHAIQIIKKKETKNLPVPPFELDYYFYTEEIDNILAVGRKRFHELQTEEDPSIE